MKLGGITNYAYICNSIAENLMNFLFVPEHNGMFRDLTDRLLFRHLKNPFQHVGLSLTN